ncbi:cobalamin biosynthesis protein [Bradyrhizobium sp. U87765 SZCCT0131]|uniref:adenosylcobinamide-phosphate synthase CbiB n=1 Tax=unclassified Bradyrhizobium TaxID=2631580 RepID=UPI001BAD443D|nr:MULTISPECIES: adenosylcobinamide-phosphate synthase CbiB [unclassified Bradyrhizobium]MBR1217470.1 cobalamin biosynthesis protein [Bradyrhizobium sp. U87765 SZCCT0131]MBR1264933.1 cobalamin biosynthesis protein [Bradyrhizobium sp. U87765 SZCCT0134]MBR1304915.1 cobalamin biosynthesis protein [Bradyrhizobium sp. U87765 SZCCT0110]MBR1320701.1 cobalamin biosynthesis protein [Bradyrhizobium sp. U87765 SZCCT0109]MBR1349121.1 cobalamin biosynthesis protein [Bradyrhizobium sp. U87765 SZCCT0048]
MATWSGHLVVVVAALALDAVIGDPDWLWRRLPHPIVLIGRAIDALDHGVNREAQSPAMRRLAGVLATTVLVATALLVGYLIDIALRALPGGQLLVALVAAIFIAQRSLYDHVAGVADAFATGGLADARRAVSMIVGRDPAWLDDSGVCRAAIESCAENFSDGVVAPVFWLALLGLPGLIAYKAINTADSMIGHRTARHEAFGWAAARLDDLVNLIPARFAGALVALAAPLAHGAAGHAFRVMMRDAGEHRSPNAGWPEAAMAGALGLALAGPRRYATYSVDDAFLNADGRKDATATDIRRALRVMAGVCALQAMIYGMLLVVAVS